LNTRLGKLRFCPRLRASKTDWSVTKSARLLGLSRDMLRYRIEKLGLARPDKRQW